MTALNNNLLNSTITSHARKDARLAGVRSMFICDGQTLTVTLNKSVDADQKVILSALIMNVFGRSARFTA